MTDRVQRLPVANIADWMPVSAEEREALADKQQFRIACARLGLTCDDGTVCKRGAARWLTEHWKRTTESTVRGWIDDRNLARRPPKSATALMNAHADAAVPRGRTLKLESA